MKNEYEIYFNLEQKKNKGYGRKYKTSAQVFEKAEAYFRWCIENPIQKIEVGKGGQVAGKRIEVDMPRPFTVEGICGSDFLSISRDNYYDYLRDGKNTEVQYAFATIDSLMKNQKLEQAAIGNFSFTLVARMVGLADNQNINTELSEETVKHFIEFGGKKIAI